MLSRGKISSQLHAAVLMKYINHIAYVETAPSQRLNDATTHPLINNPRLNLFAYVSAQCFQKMRDRFMHPTHSKPYYECVTLATISSQLHSEFPPLQPVYGPEGQRNAAFLKAISHPWNDQFLQLSSIPIRRLLTIAEKLQTYAPSSTSTFPLIYTKDTYREFQDLLHHVLCAYSKALEDMNDIKCLSNLDDTLRYEQCIHALTAAGLTLRTIANTTFFEDHLSRLRFSYNPAAAASIPDVRNEYDSNGDGDHDDNVTNTGRDARSLVVQLRSASSKKRHTFLVAIILDWVRRLVIPYDAASQLLESPIGGKGRLRLVFVAVAPPPNVRLPWRDVVRKALENIDDFTDSIEDVIASLDIIFRRDGVGQAATQHCEATLAAMIANDKLPVSMFYLQLIAPSHTLNRMQ